MSGVSRTIDPIEVTFDDPNLVANAGLLVVATLVSRLGLEGLINRTVRLVGRVGGARPGRKILTLVHTIVAGGSHIDHADVLRAGATQRVLPFRVMAPSTLGTFLRAFTFGHVRQLDAVIAESLRRAWALGAGPGNTRLVMDVDSTICEVVGKNKQGAGYGYTHVLGYHPILATRADTGEVLHARMRKGQANTSRGARRFIEELIARVRRAGATGELVVRVDSGFWSKDTIATLGRLGVRYTMAVRTGNTAITKVIAAIDETAWVDIDYTPDGRAQVAECTYRGRRLIVRRTRLTDTTQALWPEWRHHAFLTDLNDDTVTIDKFHRQHAVVELAIRPQRRRRSRTLPIRTVLRQRGVARVRSPRPQPHPLDRPPRRHPPRRSTHRRAHHPHPPHRAPRPARQPQRPTHTAAPDPMAMGRPVPHRAHTTARDPAAHLNTPRPSIRNAPLQGGAMPEPGRETRLTPADRAASLPTRHTRPEQNLDHHRGHPRHAITASDRWIED